MPIFNMKTNLAGSKISTNFVNELSKLVALQLNKPQSYVVVSIENDAKVFWGPEESQNQPAAICTLSSIGGISREKNKEMSKAIQSLIENHLGISSSRQYLVFFDLKGENVGYQGNTFG